MAADEVTSGSNATRVTVTEVPTYYVILVRDASGYWVQHEKNVPANSAESAIRKCLKDDDKPAGTYVAVPARSWKPVTVQAVQTTVLKLDPT